MIYIKNNLNKSNFSKEELDLLWLDVKFNININWLIGFIEAEGTFGLKSISSPYFQLPQKNTSELCLIVINKYL